MRRAATHGSSEGWRLSHWRFVYWFSDLSRANRRAHTSQEVVAVSPRALVRPVTDRPDWNPANLLVTESWRWSTEARERSYWSRQEIETRSRSSDQQVILRSKVAIKKDKKIYYTRHYWATLFFRFVNLKFSIPCLIFFLLYITGSCIPDCNPDLEALSFSLNWNADIPEVLGRAARQPSLMYKITFFLSVLLYSPVCTCETEDKLYIWRMQERAWGIIRHLCSMWSYSSCW